MRFALVTPAFHPVLGGQESRFRALGSELARRGHQVDVFCTGLDQHLARKERIDGMNVERFPCTDRPVHRLRFLGSRHMARVERVVTLHSRYAFGVWRRLRSRDYDVVYINQYPLVHILAIPRRVRSRSGIDWCELRRDFPHPLAQRWLPKMVAFNLCVQEDLAATLSEESGLPIGYLPSGAFLDRYRRDPLGDRRGWLFIGRWFPNKRLPLLIESWARFRASGGQDPLIIVGDGPDKAAVESAIAALPGGLRTEVATPGRVDDATKASLLANARLMLLTSDREGFPNVVVEAMASALPVVTVDDPLNGTAGVVRSLQIGEVCEPDPGSISATAHRVLESWERYSARSAEAAKEFDWSLLVDRFLQALPTGMEAHPGSANAR